MNSGISDPGRLLRDKAEPEEPGTYVSPRSLSPPEPPRPAITGQRFILAGFTVSGITAYPPETFAAIFEARPGAEIDRGEPDAWAAQIAARYRNDGYIFARSNARIDEHGQVLISIREGRIGRVTVEGGETGQHFMELMAARIIQPGPANIKDIELTALLINDLAEVTAKSVLQAAGDDAFDVTILITPTTPVSSVSFDNYGSRYNGPFEMTGQTAVNGLFVPFGQTSLGGITSLPTGELGSVQIGQTLPLGSNGTTASVQIARAESYPGYRLAVQDVASVSNSFQMQISHPIIRSRSENLFLTAGFSLRNTATDVLGFELSRDRLRVASATMAYDFQDFLEGANQLQVEVDKALRS